MQNQGQNQRQTNVKPTSNQRQNNLKTPTLPKTGEEWGTQKAWKREAKAKSKTKPKHHLARDR
jgi:hypothetical protein